MAKAKGRLRGEQPKLKPGQEKHLVQLWNDGTHTTAELADLFNVGRSMVYRAIQRGGVGTETARWRPQNAATQRCCSQARVGERASACRPGRGLRSTGNTTIFESVVLAMVAQTSRAMMRR